MVSPVLLIVLLASASPHEPTSYDGFNNAVWGSPPEKVRQDVNATGWQADAVSTDEFPKELSVSVFRSEAVVAGYKASVKYYFWNNRFFQATVRFTFDELAKYDFNYNVYRSVNDYYGAIRNRTILFVKDIYNLLTKKYGRKKPYFKGLDPQKIFIDLDAYLKKERWNLKYHPYDYYQHIATQAYARWDYPKTRAIFSVAINAPEKRFDYTLSLASIDLAGQIDAAKDSLRMRGL
jgi:hypothetical protein